MRSYRQYCAIARALDIVGDRWTLLIVRELMLRDRLRYTDLRNGLPGIATNLLAERLRALEQAGIVAREEASPPIATAVFSLTARGRELEPALQALGRWGLALMGRGMAAGDSFRSHWLTWPADVFLTDNDPLGPPLRAALCVDGEDVVLTADGGRVMVTPGTVPEPALKLSGSSHAILAVLSGQLLPEDGEILGVTYEGDLSALERLLPARSGHTRALPREVIGDESRGATT